MLRQVIVDDQGVPARVTEILAHRHAGVRGEVLQRGRVAGRGGDDDAIGHGPELFEYLDDARHRRALLADGDVDADDVLALLVDDGVHRDGGLAGLPVADDQLPLATPDGDHRVDGLDPGLQGLAHGLALDHPGRPDLHTAELLGRDRPFAVQRGANRVDDPPDDGLPDGDFRNPARPLDQIPLLDMLVGAQDHRTDVVLFQVERDPLETAGELQQLAGHRPVQPVDLGDAVLDLQHGADFGYVYLLLEGLHLLSDDGTDLCGFDLHACCSLGYGVRLCSCEDGAQAFQVPADRSVVHSAAEANLQPADHPGIDLDRQVDLAARRLLEPRPDRGSLRVGKRPGGYDLDRLAIRGLVGELAEGVADLPDEDDPVLADDVAEEPAGDRRAPGLSRHLIDDSGLLLLGKDRTQQ